MPSGSNKPSSKSNGRERRAIERVMMTMQVEVRIPSEAPPARARMLQAELIDIGRDGRGAAVVVGVSGDLPLGAPITVFTRDDGRGIHGTIVSRIGMSGRYRVGIRIDEQSRDRVQSLIPD